MIPILYPANETQFRTNGLGALKDVTSCEVHEVLNGEYELTMEYPVTGQHFDDIKKTRLVLAKPSPQEDPQPFEIYKIDKALNGNVTIYAQHISYRLSLIPVAPFTASSPLEAVQKITQKAFLAVPFTITVDTTRTGEFSLEQPKSVRAVIGDLLTKYGLEVRWSGFNVYLTTVRGADNGVKISYGKNLTELSHESDIQETATGIVPYWTGMGGTGTGTDTLVGDLYIDQDKDQRYPYSRVITYDFSNWFPEGHVPTKSELNQAAVQYMANYQNGLPDETTNLSFIPLWLTEEFKDRASVEMVSLGDTIRVTSENIGADITARIVEVTWDVLKERYEDLITGKARSGLSEQFTKVEEKIENDTALKTAMQIAIDKATDMITGNNGGYIKFQYDADGKPYEMLVMDTDDIATAQNVWRFNQAGLGHSSNGYNGPYSLAMLMDGSINASMITTGDLNANLITTGALNADLITTGTLNADLIRSGVIRDQSNRLYFDLNNARMECCTNWQIHSYDSERWFKYRMKRQLSTYGDSFIVDIDPSSTATYTSQAGDSALADIRSGLFTLYGDKGEEILYGMIELTIHDAFSMSARYGGHSYNGVNLFSYQPDTDGTYRIEFGGNDVPLWVYCSEIQVIQGGYRHEAYNGEIQVEDGNGDWQYLYVRNGIICTN